MNVYNSYDDYDYYYREYPLNYKSRIIKWEDLKNNTTIGKREMNFRGGILPYRRTASGGFEVCLGVTNNPRYANLTLIGGGRDPTDNNILDTAMREFHEETGGRLTLYQITEDTVCYDSIDSTTFLVYSNNKAQSIDLMNINANPELSSLKWIPIVNGRLQFKGHRLDLSPLVQSELDRIDGLLSQSD